MAIIANILYIIDDHATLAVRSRQHAQAKQYLMLFIGVNT